MKDTLWLVCNASGVKATRKTRPNARDLGLRERAIRIDVVIPPEAFEPPGIPTATVEIPASALLMPEPSVTLDVVAPEPPEEPPTEPPAPARCGDCDGCMSGAPCNSPVPTYAA